MKTAQNTTRIPYNTWNFYCKFVTNFARIFFCHFF